MREKQSDNELEPCEYYLKPEASDLGSATHADVEVCEIDDHDLMQNVEFNEQYEQLLEPCPAGKKEEHELGWRCRRLTPPQEDCPTLCPFHQDPAEREVDDSDLARVFLAIIRDERHESPLFREFAERHVSGDSRKAEAFLRVDPPEDSSEHAESVARRRKMFCGARFGQLSLPDQVFATPNRYPIDLQAATVTGLDFERAVINEPITANGIHTPPDVDEKLTFKKADIDGELSLKGLVTEDKVSLSESMITDDVLLRNVCVEDEVSVRDATVGGKMDMYNAEVNTTVRFIGTEIAGKLSLSNLKAGKFRLDGSSVGENVSLHQASIDTTLQINGTSIERQCSLNDGTVDGKAVFERTEIGGDVILNNAKLARSWGRVSFEEAVIGGDMQLDPERYLIIGGDISFEEAAIDGEVSLTRQMSVDGGLRINSVSVTTLELHQPEVNGPIDLRELSAERLRIEPPTVENRHPAINAITIGGCHVGTAELAPSATGETDDTVVYDIEAGAIETLETRPETVPRGKSLYDYLRLVETDFAEIDFSVHRDQLFRNNWDLHGLREGGERDVLLARAAASGDFLTEETDNNDDEAVAARAREWTDAWLEGRASTTDGITEEIPLSNERTGSHTNWPPVDDNAVQQPRQEPRGTRGIDVDEQIEKSGVLSGLERIINTIGHAGAWLAKVTGSGSVRQSIDQGPRTITLDQLESTYAGAKAAADANGENGVASIFFVREQRYIQLQNRKHIREEFVATYLAAGQSVRRKVASVTDRIKSVIKRPRVAGSDGPSGGDGSATESNLDNASELERDTLPEDEATQSTETPHSDRDATATVVDSTVPASSNLRTLRRYLLAWLSNGSLRVFTTYGESPRRVLGWWAGIILTWTWLYYLVTISRVGVASAWEVLVDQGPGFVLLSIGSFTTVIPPIPILPFGDSAVPRYAFLEDDPMITLLSGVEGLLGILFVSLFVLTLTRSIQR